LNAVSTTSLRYFAEVVCTGSIRATPETLFVASSAISQQLAMLEDALGTMVLGRRQGRGRSARALAHRVALPEPGISSRTPANIREL